MRLLIVVLLLLLLAPTIHTQNQDLVVVTVQRANLRGTAASDGTVVSNVTRGQTFAVLMRRGQWVLVQTPEYVGWLHGTVVAEHSADKEPSFTQLLENLDNSNSKSQQKRQNSSSAESRLESNEPLNPNRLPLGSSPLGSGVKSGNSSLSVENGTDNDALVRVIRFGASEQLVRNFYVPAYRTFTAEELPSGFYVMRVAFGRDCNEPERRFNFRQSFSQTEAFEVKQTISIETVDGGYRETTRYSKLSITLHKVRDGNFTSKQISESDFWSLGKQP